jgi:hypothetical protein
MSNLIVRNDATLTVAFDPSAFEQKEAALASAALIGRVSSPEEQAEAVEAQKAIKALLKLVEDSRVAAKEPVLRLGKTIDSTAKQFCLELDKELQRLMTLCGDYQTFLEKKRMAEEASQRKALEEIDRKRQEELAQARNAEHMEAIQEKYCNIAAASTPVPKPIAKAEGQVVTHEWDFAVVDAWALCRAFPNCIKPEPIRSEIKRMLDAGHTLPGVSAKKVVKSGVRLTPQSKLIEVAS